MHNKENHNTMKSQATDRGKSIFKQSHQQGINLQNIKTGFTGSM